MLSFHMSQDPHSEDIRRDGKLIGFLQWHRNNRKIVIWEQGCDLTLDELQQCTERLSGKDATPGYSPEIELGREITKGSRAARVDRNRCADLDGGKEFAVFMRTSYLKHWYYDGYRAFDELAQAVEFRDKWLNNED